MAYLPDDDTTQRVTHSHPYRRTYTVNRNADWQTNANFCKQVKEQFPMKESRHLLDFMDTAILDFLIGNADRHNYQQFWYKFQQICVKISIFITSMKNSNSTFRQCVESFVSYALRSRTKVRRNIKLSLLITL